MRSLWTGTIGFGLVNIPVKLYSGSSEQGLDLDMLHKKDQSPIRYAKVCKEEGEEVAHEDIVKGFQYEDGKYIVLTDEDFEKANATKTGMIEIVSFALISEIDASYYEKPYLVEPQKGGDRAYALLCEALNQSEKVGVARFVLRNREHMALVRAQGNALILNQLRFAHELHSAEDLKLPSSAKVDKQELKMALSLIEQHTEAFTPEDFKDTYTEELERIIEEKVQGKVPTAKGEKPVPSKVADLMSLLKASIDKKNASSKKSSREESDKAPKKKATSRARRKAS